MHHPEPAVVQPDRAAAWVEPQLRLEAEAAEASLAPTPGSNWQGPPTRRSKIGPFVLSSQDRHACLAPHRTHQRILRLYGCENTSGACKVNATITRDKKRLGSTRARVPRSADASSSSDVGDAGWRLDAGYRWYTKQRPALSRSTGRTIEEVCPRRASSRSLLREAFIGLGPLPPLLEALAVFTAAGFGERFFTSDLEKKMVVLTAGTMHARDAGPWRARAQEFQSA